MFGRLQLLCEALICGTPVSYHVIFRAQLRNYQLSYPDRKFMTIQVRMGDIVVML